MRIIKDTFAPLLAALAAVLIFGIGQAQYKSDAQSANDAGSAELVGTLDESRGDDGGLGTGVYVEDFVIGDPNAPLTIVEYASWTCPHCKSFHDMATKPVIMPLVEEGKARFIQRALLRNWVDLRVALSARCDGIDFKTAADSLFAVQAEYSVNDPDTVNSVISNALGLDATALEACQENQDLAKWLVTLTRGASELGVTGTPTLFVNGEKFDLRNVPSMDQDLRAMVEAVQ